MADKEDVLNDFLFNLSQNSYSEDKIIEASECLVDVYNSGYRHSYSQIFGTIRRVKQEKEFDFQALADNIGRFKKHVVDSKEDEFIAIRPYLVKLYDHVELEISRLSYFDSLVDSKEDLRK